MAHQFNPKTGRRGIEWTDRTVGVFGGCMHECQWQMPDGTRAICYAKELAESGVAQKAYPQGFEHHYFRESALKDLVSGKTPELIFCDSMADMFAANVPDEQIIRMLLAMSTTPHHSYQSLTKAPGRLLKFTPHFPPNLWVGASSPPDWFMGKELSRKAQEAMFRHGLEVLEEVKKRTGNIVWVSAEPVSWDLAEVMGFYKQPLDWVVIGAASSGPRYFQPDALHVRRLLGVLDALETAVFYKGNIKATFNYKPFETDELNRWREDFPAVYTDGKAIPAVMARQRNCVKYGWTRAKGIELTGELPTPEAVRGVSLPIVDSLFPAGPSK